MYVCIRRGAGCHERWIGGGKGRGGEGEGAWAREREKERGAMKRDHGEGEKADHTQITTHKTKSQDLMTTRIINIQKLYENNTEHT